MKIISEIGLVQFQAWSGAVETKNKIIDLELENDFDNMIYDMYPEGLTDTELNDLLWFEPEWVFENLGIVESEE